MPKASQPLPLVKKYKFYEEAVQSHDNDIDFINTTYKKIVGEKPLTFREDFGGTAAMACDWVKQSEKHEAWGIDLDHEPQAYGVECHYSKLNEEQKTRMHYINGNVLDNYEFKTDTIAAFNFSYFIFKERKQLLEYFKKVRAGLNENGLFFMDIFGGTECYDVLEEETEYDDFHYYWDCDYFNPINNQVLYYIHFKDKEDKMKYERVFTYDWRQWSIQEIREILEEAGFSNSWLYWEEDGDDGEGNGEFYPSEEEENCESWVCYIVAQK